MDAFKDFLSQLNQRFSSPFLVSFFIFWLAYNWPILVALGWFDTNQTEDGYQQLVWYINHSLSWRSEVCPLLLAFGYTLVGPFINNVVSAYKTFSEKYGDKWSLRIGEGSAIPIEKHLKLRSDYRDNLKELADIITQEKSLGQELAQTRSELIKAQQEQTATLNELATYQRIVQLFNDVSIMNGLWTRKLKSDPTSNGTSEDIRIQNGTIYFVESGVEKYRINGFAFNSNNGTVTFILLEKRDAAGLADRFLAFDSLNVQGKTWVGTEFRRDAQEQVAYTRVDQ